MARNYKNIKVWQAADKLIKEIYQVTTDFPREEVYGLTSQIRRAAVSVACNIVEGAARDSDKEYLHFLYIARGSLAETEYLLLLAESLGFLSTTEFESINSICQECMRMLQGLITVIRK